MSPFRSKTNKPLWSRRNFLAASALAGGGILLGGKASGEEFKEKSAKKKALVAISLDLEMARNFPKWEDTHWDYEKGNLNQAAKDYAVRACERLRKRGGVIHAF